MPKLANVKKTPNNFQFSHVNIGDLKGGGSQYTVFRLDIDVSGSTHGFSAKQEELVKHIITNLQAKKDVADKVLMSIWTFDTHLTELCGYDVVKDMDPDIAKGKLRPGGFTALLDSMVSGEESMHMFAEQELVENDYEVNGIHVIITDGCEYGRGGFASKMRYPDVEKALSKCKSGEALESSLTIIVTINELDSWVKEMNQKLRDEVPSIDQFEDAGNFTDDVIDRLTGFVVSSVSTQSKAVGTGQSQTIQF